MSAPLQLTAAHLQALATALVGLSAIRRETGIEIGSYGRPSVTVLEADVTLDLSWSDDAGYYIDDRSGS